LALSAVVWIGNLPEVPSYFRRDFRLSTLRVRKETSMRRYVLLAHIGLGLILAGCTAAPLPFAPEFYRSPRTTPLSTPLAAVAVYQFMDKRPVANPTDFGEHPLGTGTYGRTVFFHATEPIATGVARAFAEGLRARGFQVLDRTMKPLSREREEEPSPPAISGEVLAFSASSRRTGLVSYVGGAAFHVRVQVYGRQLAEARWERVYSNTSDAFLLSSQLVFLSRSLAESMEDTVNDPTFLEALRRSSD
jgi:hypothetical protein